MRFWPLPTKGLAVLLIVCFVIVAGGIGLYATWHSLLAGGLPSPIFRVQNIDTFSLSLGVLQITLTAMIIVIAIFAFLGFQNIKTSAIDKAESVARSTATEMVNELDLRRKTLEGDIQPDRPSPFENQLSHDGPREPGSDRPRSKESRLVEEGEKTDVPKG